MQGSIDARSSKPPVKEDDVDRDRRHESAKKLKSARDLEKKKEKKKNLARQALETHRAKSRQRGSLRKNPPMRMMALMLTTTATTLRGWRPVSTGSSRACLRPASTSRGRESKMRCPADLVRVNRGSHLHAALAPTFPQRRCKVGPSPTPNLLPCLRRGH